MHREYCRWHSPHLGREMEMLVFGDAGTRVIVFPTREGRFFDYENWGLAVALQERLGAGALQLFCVDSVDSESFYARHQPPGERIARHLQYERYVLDEVLPFSASKNPGSPAMTHGCSIGAYHAVNLALRHPREFSRVVALSGRHDLTKAAGSFPDLFDGYYDDSIYFQMPTHYLPNIVDPALLADLRKLEITLAVGETDACAISNQVLSSQLDLQGIPNHLYLWNGEAHRARHWMEMVRLYL